MKETPPETTETELERGLGSLILILLNTYMNNGLTPEQAASKLTSILTGYQDILANEKKDENK